MPAETLLSVEGVSKRFAGVLAVDAASFTVARGSITALIGPNGAGKSTLFNVVTGFERGDAGEVRAGRPLRLRLEPAHHCAQGNGAHVPAHEGAIRDVRARQHAARGARQSRRAARALGAPAGVAGGRAARRAQAFETLAVFGLADKAHDYAGTLSGGQRKLLELARALMLEPRILLLDEPLAGVNPTLGRVLLEHIEALRAERGLTILLVEHDMEVVMRHSDVVVVMAEGRVVVTGPPDVVRRDPRVIEAYLGAGASSPGPA